MQEKELQLWLQVKNNNQKAFNDLYLQTIDLLYLYGYGFSNDKAIIEESIQQVYVDLWMKRNRIEVKSSFRFYLLKTFRRRLVKNIKVKKKVVQIEFAVKEDWRSNIEDQIISQEENKIQQKQLAKARESLTPRQEEALFLKFHQNLRSPAIAELMGLQTSAVYKLISTALIRLRNYF